MVVNGNDYGMPSEIYERYKSDGFSDKEIEQIWEDRAAMLMLYSNKDDREITSSTYIRSQRALTKQVERWLGIR